MALPEDQAPRFDAHFPGQPPIDAYGSGGFRFADMSHRGSLLFLPSGVWGWEPKAATDLQLEHFSRVLAEAERIGVLLLGSGGSHVFPPRQIRQAIEAAGIVIESMTTGAAARTYNILLAEHRRVAAALIAVD